jgi:ParB-like chromosome segregation protein Spo0J
MSLKKIMQKKGPEMVNAAAKEISANTPVELQPRDPKALSTDAAAKIIQEIRQDGKLTTSVPISKIIIDENVRYQFSQESIKELGESFKDVGLLHKIILHIVEEKGNFYFHCVSGKRRVLAAKSIGWEIIDATVTLGADPTEALYIGAIANLHEAVFWLDNALLYSKLNLQGNTDDQIAARVKVNSRTIGWFRRLTKMSISCQTLAYAHSDLFNSRWAQQVARHGELPDNALLEQHMRQMVIQKRTWHTVHDEIKKSSGTSSIDKSDAIVTAHRVITNFEPEHLIQTKDLLTALTQCGFLTQTAFKKIQREFFKKTPSKSVSLSPCDNADNSLASQEQ